MGHAVGLGRDPRAVTEAARAPPPQRLPVADGARAGDPAVRSARRDRRTGAAVGRCRCWCGRSSCSGSAMVEMRQAPDPRILVEVALVQLTNDEAGTDIDALLARIERLENTVKQLREAAPDVAPAAAQAPKDPATGRAVLGGAARGQAGSGVRHPSPPAPTPAAPRRLRQRPPLRAPAISVPEAWEQSVKGQVKPIVRALYSVGSFVGNNGDTWQFSVPNEAHGAKCGEHRAGGRGGARQGGRLAGHDRVRGRSPGRRRRPAAATPEADRSASKSAATAPDRHRRPRRRPQPTPTRPTTRSTCPSSPTPRRRPSRPRSTAWPRRSPAPSSSPKPDRGTTSTTSWPAPTPLPSNR